MKSAENIFKDTDIKTTTEGRRHIGATIGTQEFKNNFVVQKVEEWVAEIKVITYFTRVPTICIKCLHTWTTWKIHVRHEN